MPEQKIVKNWREDVAEVAFRESAKQIASNKTAHMPGFSAKSVGEASTAAAHLHKASA